MHELFLLEPADLPSDQEALARAVRAAREQHDHPAISDAELLGHIAAALRHEPAFVPVPQSTEQIGGKTGPGALAEHDFYFLVHRVHGDPAVVYRHSVLLAYRELLESARDMGSTMDDGPWCALRDGFDAMLHYVDAPFARFACGRRPQPAGELSVGDYDPHRRWRAGHHLFFVQIQSLVIAVNCLTAAFEADDLAGAESALTLMTVLMASSAATLRFAADFSPADYDELVVPSMKPPYLEPGFSGIQSRDHLYLVRLLMKLKPRFRTLDPRLAPTHQRFVEALADAYDAHALVCSRFGGEDRPSLLMAGEAPQLATQAIRSLKRNRLRTVNP